MVNSLNWQVPLTHLSANHSVEADCHSLIWFPLAQVLHIVIMEAMNEDLIAPCGMNCGVCDFCLAMKNDLKRKGFAKTYCAGCLQSDRNCHHKRRCELPREGLVRFYYDCQDFPCHRLKTLDKRYRTSYGMSMIENLEYIKEHGMETFLEREMAKWHCPECGGVICCHNGLCYKCRLDNLCHKKHKYRREE
jgi:hypothetical protein